MTILGSLSRIVDLMKNVLIAMIIPIIIGIPIAWVLWLLHRKKVRKNIPKELQGGKDEKNIYQERTNLRGDGSGPVKTSISEPTGIGSDERHSSFQTVSFE